MPRAALLGVLAARGLYDLGVRGIRDVSTLPMVRRAQAAAERYVVELPMMQKRLRITTLVFVGCSLSCAQPGAGALKLAAVPVYAEPHHHLQYESKFVRVLDVVIRPGDTTLFHVHADRHAGVVIGGARTWTHVIGGRDSTYAANAIGTLSDNTGDALPFTHRVANIDTVDFHLVLGQFLAASGIASPVIASDGTLQLVRETARGRMYRVTLAPGQSTSSHRHAQPGLTIQVTAGTVVWDGDAVAARSAESRAGAWWWRDAGHSHVLRNVGPLPIQLVEIDWK